MVHENGGINTKGLYVIEYLIRIDGVIEKSPGDTGKVQGDTN